MLAQVSVQLPCTGRSGLRPCSPCPIAGIPDRRLRKAGHAGRAGDDVDPLFLRAQLALLGGACGSLLLDWTLPEKPLPELRVAAPY